MPTVVHTLEGHAHFRRWLLCHGWWKPTSFPYRWWERGSLAMELCWRWCVLHQRFLRCSCTHSCSLLTLQRCPLKHQLLHFSNSWIDAIVPLMHQVYFQNTSISWIFSCLRSTIKIGRLQEIVSLLTVDLWLLANTVLIVSPGQNWYLRPKKCFKSK